MLNSNENVDRINLFNKTMEIEQHDHETAANTEGWTIPAKNPSAAVPSAKTSIMQPNWTKLYSLSGNLPHPLYFLITVQIVDNIISSEFYVLVHEYMNIFMCGSLFTNASIHNSVDLNCYSNQ